MDMNPAMIAGTAKMRVWIVISVTRLWFLIPRVLRTANSYFLSSTSVCMSEKIRMKLNRHRKKMTVMSTLLSMYPIMAYCSMFDKIGVSLVMLAESEIYLKILFSLESNPFLS